MISEIVAGLAAIGKVRDLWARGDSAVNDLGANSLIEYTQSARVEPIVLIDTDCLYLDCISDVQQSLLSIFAGYYLQAVAISTNVGKINVLQNLEKLNPNRDASSNVGKAAMGWMLANENYKHTLPSFDKLSLESNDESDKRDNSSSFEFGRDTSKDLKELANLSVGKIFSVEITDGLHSKTIPISIRLLASSLPSASLVHILSIGSNDISAKERFHGWKSGRLEYIKDLWLCQDLIDAHRKNLMTDKDGVYSNIVKRANGNAISAAATGNLSIATASNLAIISTNTEQKLELNINGKLKDFKTREKLFSSTYLMILVVLDNSWNRATFYHRGVHLPTEINFKDLKSANKGDGISVTDVMRAYQLGNSPSI